MDYVAALRRPKNKREMSQSPGGGFRVKNTPQKRPVKRRGCDRRLLSDEEEQSEQDDEAESEEESDEGMEESTPPPRRGGATQIGAAAPGGTDGGGGPRRLTAQLFSATLDAGQAARGAPMAAVNSLVLGAPRAPLTAPPLPPPETDSDGVPTAGGEGSDHVNSSGDGRNSQALLLLGQYGLDEEAQGAVAKQGLQPMLEHEVQGVAPEAGAGGIGGGTPPGALAG